MLAARFMGVRDRTIVTRHILPNVASLLIVDATINVSAAIIAETGLSYFGFGVQPPDVSLGTLIADGTTAATTHAWLFAFPAALLVITVLAVNLVGDGLREALDPSSGSAHERGRAGDPRPHGDLRRRSRRRARGARDRSRPRARRGARACRRVGLRQVGDGAGHHRAAAGDRERERLACSSAARS